MHKAGRSLIPLAFLACLNPSAPADPLPQECAYGRSVPPTDVPQCLYARGLLKAADRDTAIQVLTGAAAAETRFRSDSGIANFHKASELTRALAHIQEYYSRGLFEDSARFHRLLDHVLVTIEYVSDTTLHYDAGGHAWPSTTPYLAWVYYPSAGMHFQPVTTSQYVVSVVPKPTVPTDSLVGIAEHLYEYAVWRDRSGLRFPVWEYQFTWTSGGITDIAPWVSGMAQGLVLETFAAAFQRTGDPMWLRRSREVLNSYRVNWDEGGVLLPDTSHGFWWEEFNPVVRVWNGSVQALVAVGYFWQVTGDSSAKRMFDRGLEALRFYTPLYDTGNWTLYSLTQGYNSVAYHKYEIALLDTLAAMSGDPWCKETADRWRTYTPPPGVR